MSITVGTKRYGTKGYPPNATEYLYMNFFNWKHWKSVELERDCLEGKYKSRVVFGDIQKKFLLKPVNKITKRQRIALRIAVSIAENISFNLMR